MHVPARYGLPRALIKVLGVAAGFVVAAGPPDEVKTPAADGAATGPVT